MSLSGDSIGAVHNILPPPIVSAGSFIATREGGGFRIVRRISIFTAALVLVVACKVEKTGQDTYKVVAPTPEAKAAAQKAKDDAQKAVHNASESIAKKTESSKTQTTSTTVTTE